MEDEWDALVPQLPVASWRQLPMLRALVGAGTLARRAGEPARAGRFDPMQLEVLGALAVIATDADRAEATSLESLASALALPPAGLAWQLHSLQRRELVEPEDVEEERPWRITQDGMEEAAQWIGRCAGLFGGWPPAPRDADDTT